MKKKGGENIPLLRKEGCKLSIPVWIGGFFYFLRKGGGGQDDGRGGIETKEGSAYILPRGLRSKKKK